MCLGSLSLTPGVTVYNEVVRAAAGIFQPLHVLFKHFKQYSSTAAIYHETEIRWPAAGVFISMVVPLLGDERSTHFGKRQITTTLFCGAEQESILLCMYVSAF